MAIMERIKRLSASLLYFVTLSVLLIGSCLGPGVMYIKSPYWFLEKVDIGDTSIGVAFISQGDAEPGKIKVMWYNLDSERKEYPDVQFHLPNGQLYGVGPGKATSSIYATADKQGGQLIQVFTSGDAPWTALSEYRVIDNKVYPLRRGNSQAWLLLGLLFCPIIVYLLQKPIRRGINLMMRIDPE